MWSTGAADGMTHLVGKHVTILISFGVGRKQEQAKTAFARNCEVSAE